MELRTVEFPGGVRVSLAGPVEIDLSCADRFRERLEAATAGRSRAVLDVSNVQFFDSAGMGALLGVHRTLEERGGALVLAGVTRPVLEVFRMVGFDMVFRMFPDADAAVEALEGPA